MSATTAPEIDISELAEFVGYEEANRILNNQSKGQD